jgi:hypothetical protein
MKSIRGSIARNQLFICQNPFDNYIVKIADNQRELEGAFKLIGDHSIDGLKITPYHALPTTSVIILIKDNAICGAITVIKDSTYGLPIDDTVDLSLFRKNQRLCQLSSLAIAPEYRKDGGRYLFLMMKYLFSYVENYMYCDTVLFSAHPSMAIFLDEVLFFDSFPKSLIKDNPEKKQSILRFAFLSELHQRWKEKYFNRPNENNLSYFFDISKENKFIFPNRLYFKDHDPVLNKEMMGLFFMKMTSVLNEMSAPEKHRLLHFYYLTPFFEPLKRYFNITEELDLPRKDLRHDVLNHGRLLNGRHSQTGSSKIFNVSKEGLSIQINRESELVMLNQNSYINLVMQVGLGRRSVLKIEPVRGQKNRSLIGCRIVDADSQWENYIDFLNNDLMKDVFRKV